MLFLEEERIRHVTSNVHVANHVRTTDWVEVAVHIPNSQVKNEIKYEPKHTVGVLITRIFD